MGLLHDKTPLQYREFMDNRQWHYDLSRRWDGSFGILGGEPFLHPELLRALCEGSEGYDVYLPESRGPRGCEPLCAVYGPACADPIARAVDAGDLRATAFHSEVKVGLLPIREVERYGNPDEIFLNVNTPEELAAARALYRRRRDRPPHQGS